jgi:hypothetical protein
LEDLFGNAECVLTKLFRRTAIRFNGAPHETVYGPAAYSETVEKVK